MKKSKLLLGALLLASVFAVTSCNIGGGQQQTSTSAQQSQNSSTSVNNPSSSSAQSQAGTSSQNTPQASSATPSSSQESSSVAPQQSSSETTPSASSSSVAPQQSSSEQTPATSSSSSETTPTTSSTSQVTPTTSSSSEATPTTSSSQSQSTPTSTSSSSAQATTKYLVQFLDDDDTSIYSEELAEGTQIVKPADPTKAATSTHTYEFDGWYTAKTGGTKVTSFPTVSEAVTYYARYTETPIATKYTVTFVTTGSGVNPVEVVEGGTITSLPISEKENCVFAGWFTTDSYQTQFTETTKVTGPITLYAKFVTQDSNTITTDTVYSFRKQIAIGSSDIIIDVAGGQNIAAFTEQKLTIDASQGKFVYNNGTTPGGYYQINSGTKLSFTTAQAVTIKVSLYDEKQFTITGTGLNSTVSSAAKTFVTTGSGKVEISFLENNTYIKSLEIYNRDLSKVASDLDLTFTKTEAGSTTTAGNGTYKTTNLKTIYKVNESFDAAGLYGTVTYTNSDKDIVDSNTGLVISGFSSATPGKKTITASYTSGGATVSETFVIYVVDTAPSIVDNVLQVKVDPSIDDSVRGEKVGDFNIFKTISEALDYLRSYESKYSSYKKLLYVNEGTYNEKLYIDIPNLIIRGANKTNTIIEYNSLYGQKDPDGFTHVTDSTQTLTIMESATNCILYDITISNYWNAKSVFVNAGKDDEHRALALLIYADKVVVQDCILLGYQDTVEAMKGRSYFYNSFISGTVDFIFGTNCTMYFKDCTIHSITNSLTDSNQDGGYITAFKGNNKSASDAVLYGAIFDTCTFTADALVANGKTSIARPWGEYAKVAVINSNLGAHISTTAYTDGATKNQRYVDMSEIKPTVSTVHFYEFGNNGDGSISAQQNGMTMLSSDQATEYTTLSTVFGTTNGGVTYDSVWAPEIIQEAPSNVDITITEAKGYTEGAYVEFTTEYAGINAYYKKSTTSTYIPIDSQLIRITSGTGRLDVVGLSHGSYTIKLENAADSSLYVITSELTVSEDDRSGYAHFNYTDGVGAYNDTGTVKTGAKIIYVTDSTKNNIDEDGDGNGDGHNLAYYLENASESAPLDIRIIGRISTVQWNTITYLQERKTSALVTEQKGTLGNCTDSKINASTILSNNWNSYSDDLAAGITELEGLNSYASYSSSKYDTYWNMMDISEKKYITIEGIGTDAEIYQWGLTFSKCNSIEIKNLTFTAYTEDAIGIQGNGNSNIANYGNYWIHNCTFNEGVNRWDLSYEKDKGDGDGSTDFKYAHGLTISYCRYNDTHKTNLIGADNAAIQYNITLHHNYYNSCTFRLPLVRQANIHMYNNYYHGTVSHGISVRAKAFAFVENSYFDGSNPFMLAYKTDKGVNPVGTTIKAIGNIFASSVTTTNSSDNGIALKENGVYVLTTADSSSSSAYSYDSTATRTTEAVGSTCSPNGSYANFDTNDTLFYYDDTNHVSIVDIMNTASELPTLIPTVAGAGLCAQSLVQSSSSSTEEYTVTFSTDGTSVSSQSVAANGTISNLPTTAKDGYTFDGWFVDNGTFNTPFTTSTPVTEDITVYAKFTQNTSNPVISSSKDLLFGTDAKNYSSATDFEITATIVDHNANSSKLYGGTITFTVAAGATVEVYANWGQDYTITDENGDVITVEGQNVGNDGQRFYTYSKQTTITIVCDPDNDGDNYFYWIKVRF